MDRRAFLSLGPLAAAVGVSARLGGDVRSPFWHVSGQAVQPGAPFHVDLAPAVPRGSHVQVRIDHDGGRHVSGRTAALPGQRMTLQTPYPHDDLVPGDYAVHVELVGRTGRVLESQPVGTYRVLPARFSA